MWRTILDIHCRYCFPTINARKVRRCYMRALHQKLTSITGNTCNGITIRHNRKEQLEWSIIWGDLERYCHVHLMPIEHQQVLGNAEEEGSRWWWSLSKNGGRRWTCKHKHQEKIFGNFFVWKGSILGAKCEKTKHQWNEGLGCLLPRYLLYALCWGTFF